MTDCTEAFPTDYCNSLGSTPSQKNDDLSFGGTRDKVTPADSPRLGGSPTARSSFLAYKLDCSLSSGITSTEELVAALNNEPVVLRPCRDNERLLDSHFCERELIAEQLRLKSILDGVYDAGHGNIWKVAQFSMFPSDCKGSFQHRTRSGDKLQEISEWLQERKRMESLPEFLVKGASPAAPAFFLDICAGPGTWSNWLLEEIAALDQQRRFETAAAATVAATGAPAAGAPAVGTSPAEAARGAQAADIETDKAVSAGSPAGFCYESSGGADATGRYHEGQEFFSSGGAGDAAASPAGLSNASGRFLPCFASSPLTVESAAKTKIATALLSHCTSYTPAVKNFTTKGTAVYQRDPVAATTSPAATAVVALGDLSNRESGGSVSVGSLSTAEAGDNTTVASTRHQEIVDDSKATATRSPGTAQKLLSGLHAAFDDGPYCGNRSTCSGASTGTPPFSAGGGSSAQDSNATAGDVGLEGTPGGGGVEGSTQRSGGAAISTAAVAASPTSFSGFYTSESHDTVTDGHSAYGFGVSLTLHDLLTAGDSRFWHIAKEVLQKPNYEGIVGLQKSGNIYNPRNLLFIKQKVESRAHEILAECAASFATPEENNFNLSNTHGMSIAAGSPLCRSPSLSLCRPSLRNNSSSLSSSSSFSSSNNNDSVGVMKLVVADGGITIPKVSVAGQHLDNFQELLAGRLLLSELALAFALLQHGGTLVITVFDVFTPFTASLLYMCTALFEETYIVKPSRNRWTNSERQLVALNFRRVNSINLLSVAAATAEAAKSARCIPNGPALPLHTHKADGAAGCKDADTQQLPSQQQQHRKPPSSYLMPRCSRLYTAMRDKLVYAHRVLAEAISVTDYSTVLPETLLPLRILTGDAAFAESYKEMCVELCRLQCLSLQQTHDKFHELQQNPALLQNLRQRQRTLEKCMNALKVVGAAASTSSATVMRTPTGAAGTSSQHRRRNGHTALADSLRHFTKKTTHSAFLSTSVGNAAAVAGEAAAAAAADVFGSAPRSTTTSSSSGGFEPTPFILVGLPDSVATCVTAVEEPAEDIWQKSFFPTQISDHVSAREALEEGESPASIVARTACSTGMLLKRQVAEQEYIRGNSRTAAQESAAATNGNALQQGGKPEESPATSEREGLFLSSSSTGRCGSSSNTTPATLSPAVTDDGWWQLISSGDTSRSRSKLHSKAAAEDERSKCSGSLVRQKQMHEEDRQLLLHRQEAVVAVEKAGMMQPRQQATDHGSQEQQALNLHLQEGLFDVARQSGPSAVSRNSTSETVESGEIVSFPPHRPGISKAENRLDRVVAASTITRGGIDDVQSGGITAPRHIGEASVATCSLVQHASTGEKQLTHDEEAAAYYTATSVAEEVLASDGAEDKIFFTEELKEEAAQELIGDVSSAAAAAATKAGEGATFTVVKQEQLQRCTKPDWRKKSPEQPARKQHELYQQNHLAKQGEHLQQSAQQEHVQTQKRHARKEHAGSEGKVTKETEEKQRTMSGTTAIDEELSWRRAEYTVWRSCRNSKPANSHFAVSDASGHNDVHSVTAAHFSSNSSAHTQPQGRFRRPNKLTDEPRESAWLELRSARHHTIETPLGNKTERTRWHTGYPSCTEVATKSTSLISSRQNPGVSLRGSRATHSTSARATGAVQPSSQSNDSQVGFPNPYAAERKTNPNAAALHFSVRQQSERTHNTETEPALRRSTSYGKGKYGFSRAKNISSPPSTSAKTPHDVHKAPPVKDRDLRTRHVSKALEPSEEKAKGRMLRGHRALQQPFETESQTQHCEQQYAKQVQRECLRRPHSAGYGEEGNTRLESESDGKSTQNTQDLRRGGGISVRATAPNQEYHIQTQAKYVNGDMTASNSDKHGSVRADREEEASGAPSGAQADTNKDGAGALCRGGLALIGGEVSTASTLVTDAVEVGGGEDNSTSNVSANSG